LIFVEVGTQKFQFNRLIKEIDRLVAEGKITEEVFAQIGHSDYIPKHIEYAREIPHEKVEELLNKADLVITHAGTGSIIEALYKKKKVIAVPRYQRLGEHVDDHQMEIAEQLSKDGCIEYVDDISKLEDTIKATRDKSYKTYISNRQPAINQIKEWIKEYGKAI